MAEAQAVPTASNVMRAALWMLGSVLSFSSMAVAARALSSDLDTFEMMLYRSLVGIGIVLGAAWFAGRLHEITTQCFGLQVVRNISHFTGQNLWLFAVTVLPLAQVVALEFTSPLWVILMAPFILGEKVTALRVGAAALGFLGILIAARPDFGNIEPALLAAAGAAVGFAGSAVFTKVLTRHVTITAILFWLVTLQALFALVLAGMDGQIAWPQPANWPWIGVIGTSGLVAHFCLTRALGHAPALVVLPLDFIRLPLIALIGVTLYGEALEWPVVLGAAVILAANFINIRAESQRKAAVPTHLR